MLTAALFALLAMSPPGAEAHLRIQSTAPIEVTIEEGKVAGARTIRVQQGETVSLRVTSDHKLVLHLHGYDLERTAAPGAPAVFNFTAEATGRFPVETHETDTKSKGHSHGGALFYLEVRPR